MPTTRALVLGGEFLGRHLVEEVLATGHDGTVLSRGRPPLVPGARRLIGDRSTEPGVGGSRWVASGLPMTPLAVTVRDWWASVGAE